MGIEIYKDTDWKTNKTKMKRWLEKWVETWRVRREERQTYGEGGRQMCRETGKETDDRQKSVRQIDIETHSWKNRTVLAFEKRMGRRYLINYNILHTEFKVLLIDLIFEHVNC